MKKEYIVVVVIFVSLMLFGYRYLLAPSEEREAEAETEAENNTAEKNFKVFYQGFLTVDAEKQNDYITEHAYIITKESVWKNWSSKYIYNYPYSLEDMGMDWNKYCLVVEAFHSAKDMWCSISPVRAVSIYQNRADLIFDEKKLPVYVLRDDQYKETTNIVCYVVMLKKTDELNYVKPEYFLNEFDADND